MNKEEWLKWIKNLWEKKAKSLENEKSPLERAWSQGYQAALEDIYIELEYNDGTL